MNYFETALKAGRLFHSIILYGSSSYIQYAIALELARQLNCSALGAEECSCRSCSWIRGNKHPAVMTISKIDNKPAGDDSKTVISARQTELVLNTVFSSSDAHKVFIFCSADMKMLKNKELDEYNEFKETGFCPPQADDSGRTWLPSGITRLCFQDAAANSMLKSIEEPPSGVTFIFLANNPNDLISTIVSRSQAFFAPDFKRSVYNIDFLKKYFENYPGFNAAAALDFAQELLFYQEENGLDSEYIIDSIEFYLAQILKLNFENSRLADKIFRDINQLEKSKKMLRALVKETYVYEHLGFYFSGKISGFDAD